MLSEGSDRSSGKTILAFASANSRRPLYRRDVLNAVCYPDGWYLRLTYRAKWIQECLRNAISDDGLVDREILIVFCGDPDPDPDNYRLFVPLRFGRILRSSSTRQSPDENDVHIFLLALGRRPSRDLFESIVKNEQTLAPLPTVNGGEYLREFEVSSPNNSSAVRWSDQVKILKRSPELAKSKFLRIVEFKGRSSCRRRRRVPELSDVSEVELQAGKAYALNFEIPESNPEESNLPEISIQGTHIEQAEPVIHQNGVGADVSYLLTVQRKYASEVATLVARVPSADDSGVARPGGVQHPDGAPEFQALLRISPARYFWPVTIFGLTLGLSALNATPEVLEIFGWPASTVAIAKVFGGLVVAGTGAYSFRQLPVKI